LSGAPRVGNLFENGVGHIREKGVGRLLENSGLIVGHFPENSQKCRMLIEMLIRDNILLKKITEDAKRTK